MVASSSEEGILSGVSSSSSLSESVISGSGGDGGSDGGIASSTVCNWCMNVVAAFRLMALWVMSSISTRSDPQLRFHLSPYVRKSCESVGCQGNGSSVVHKLFIRVLQRNGLLETRNTFT